MVLYKSTDKVIKLDRCILALGNFDGVHVAHTQLLMQAKKYALDKGIAFGIYTFENHSKFGTELLNCNDEKLLLFEKIGADFVYFEEFECVKHFETHEFVHMILNKFNCVCTVCGENFRFGKNASGTSQNLKKSMLEMSLDAIIVPTLEFDGTPVSSTRIRNLLKDGQIQFANNLLGYDYGFTSEIIHGARLGHKLGFPTINQLVPSQKVCPKFGVYATVAYIDGGTFYGVTNIGVKPTVTDENIPVAETYIIDFDGDVYGKQVTLKLCKMLREEKRFSSLEELIENIKLNVVQTKEYFGVK